MAQNDLKQMVLDYLTENAGYNRADIIAQKLNTTRLDIDIAIHQLMQDGNDLKIVRRADYLNKTNHDRIEMRLYVCLVRS